MLAKTELDAQHQMLLDAADHIEKVGWWNGDRNPKGETSCMALALNVQADKFLLTHSYESVNIIRCKAWDILLKHMKLRQRACVVDWNDAPGRTKEEVIQKLREAAYSQIE